MTITSDHAPKMARFAYKELAGRQRFVRNEWMDGWALTMANPWCHSRPPTWWCASACATTTQLDNRYSATHFCDNLESVHVIQWDGQGWKRMSCEWQRQNQGSVVFRSVSSIVWPTAHIIGRDYAALYVMTASILAQIKPCMQVKRFPRLCCLSLAYLSLIQRTWGIGYESSASLRLWPIVWLSNRCCGCFATQQYNMWHYVTWRLPCVAQGRAVACLGNDVCCAYSTVSMV